MIAYRHKQSGTVYYMLARAIESTHARAGAHMIVYCMDLRKELFVKEEGEFNEEFELMREGDDDEGF